MSSDEESAFESDAHSDDFEEEVQQQKVVEKKQPVKKSAAPKQSTDSNANTVSNSAAAKKGSKTIEEIYQKKTQLEHILLRPDTYIGSIESLQAQMWVMDDEASKKLALRNISYVPGLYKIFDEILVNAADNKQRDSSMDTIKVTVDRENNLISIYNNGRGVPIEMHAKEGVYVPELIFGHLLTSSNYDDSEKKVTGGRNGYGAKLCNIFSTEFMIETGDAKAGKKYKQKFFNNMSKKEAPKLSSAKTEDFTRITFKPDLIKFGMEHLDDDITALFKKRAYDLAGCLPGVKVFLNDTRIKIKNFKDYIDLFSPAEDAAAASLAGKKPASSIIYERVSDRWEIAFTVSDGQFQQVSFVNGICTSKGGTHVNHVADQLVTALSELAKKKDKKGAAGKESTVKPHLVKSQLSIFVNCLIENPAFDSQTKENMTLKMSSFGSKCTMSEEFMKKVSKSGVIESILAVAKFKSDQAMKKTDGHKRSRISGIAKLDDANNAGTKNGSQCTLILTEGDSAKSLAVSGLAVVGRDNYGVFPLRGKLLNVREAASTQILNNAEITALKQIIGLQQGKKYESTKDLRYGHIMIMTDQDHDGSHIKGLIINFLDCFWPSLLKVPGFLLEFITPIVKATPKAKGGRKKEISFFTIPEYEQWKKENEDGKGFTIKYYKGLGTSTTEDAKKYFSDMELHRKSFKTLETEDTALIDMAFNKKKADDRKEWLRQFQPGTYMDHSVDEIPISDFINKELILFSMADNLRSIPSCVDGMKPGHRKILYCCFKRNLKNEIKVTQLAGYVSEHSAYHHGEASLFSTMIGMAQNFIGSNNLNLLEPRGQFGTRLQGGKDAASPRYIFTTLNPLARVIFHPEDDTLLNYMNDDGQDIEPEWYIPILPMLLINGGEGIGTGWSTSIPNYNPRDVVENIYRIMEGNDPEPMSPWYRGFKGTIDPIDKDKYKVSGTITKTSETTVEITELPVKVWTQTYKETLEAWMIGDEAKKVVPWIKDYKEYHTDSNVHFVVTLTEENMRLAEAEGLEKKFKLTNQISTSNIVCFDLEGRIAKYDNVDQLLKNFYTLRLKYYIKRKEAMLARLTFEWTKLDNKVRFIQEIITGKLVVQNRKKADILKELIKRDYFRVPKAKAAKQNEDSSNGADGEEREDEENENDGSDVPKAGDFDYLLSMPIWSLTYEKVEQLSKERGLKQEEISILSEKTPSMLWRADLDDFLVHWDAFETELREQEASKAPRKGGKSTLASKLAKKKAIAKKKGADSDDAMSISDDDDFEEKKPKEKPVIAKKKPAAASKAAEADKAPALPSWMLGGSPIPSTKLPEKAQPSVAPPGKVALVISDDSDAEMEKKPEVKKPKAKTETVKPRVASKPAASRAKKVLMDSDDSADDTKMMEKPKARILNDGSDSERSEAVTVAKPATKALAKPRVTKREVKKAVSIVNDESDGGFDSDSKADDFAFDETPPHKKSATSKFAIKDDDIKVEPKKRQLGLQKAAPPGKATKPVKVAVSKISAASRIKVSDDDEIEDDKPIPVAVKPKAAPKKPTSKVVKAPASPQKRSRPSSGSEDEVSSEKVVVNRAARPGRAKAKPAYVVEISSDEDNASEDEGNWNANEDDSD
ncbi:DNA topoisomerase 2 [Chytriomyces hyalinus]|nr:DNA topoisomerase 2 [Chytriomyces hyalinus]